MLSEREIDLIGFLVDLHFVQQQQTEKLKQTCQHHTQSVTMNVNESFVVV